MNKILIVILIVLGLALIAYNVTLVDFEDPFQGNSIIALIGIVASLCAIALLLIYTTSKKIQKKIEQD
ncbi:hypothetical protein MWU78_01145 [Arenibacter sp. F26102]|uniref:LapA family protein n=1 Tax=Arenibacter arenosicollis TaxID=2762274 RepID=A0ABR7QJS3_9FLAO|nr:MULTISPECIES: hypothetical protein [Arenibacter]MBC8767426.1 hypothetical protein [Arenibacter arenosicollis]MCK0144250.1 hypothetical protein [Arenibacter sp. F26102]